MKNISLRHGCQWPAIHSAVPVIATDDIEKSLFYYTKILGFSPDFKHGKPPVYAGVRSGEVEIYFTFDPELTRLQRENKTDSRSFHMDTGCYQPF
jgi:catechol 2,3-dioxygenase-like lactoylglutathione lyase family enzyme